MDLGNLAVAAMVFAQVFPGGAFSFRAALLGVVGFLASYSAAYYVMRGGKL